MNQPLYNDLLNATSVLLLIDKQEKEMDRLRANARAALKEAKAAHPAEAHPGVRRVWGTILGAFAMMFVIAGFVLMIDGDPEGVGAFFGGLVGLTPSVLLFVRASKVSKRHKEQMDTYYANIGLAEEGIRSVDAECVRIGQEIDQIKSKYQNELSVLPTTYWDATAASYMLLAVKDNRADSLKEAMNLYEQQNHHWELENVLSDMVKMQKIQNRFMKQAFAEIQANQEAIYAELRVIEAMQVASFVSNLF